MCSGSGIDPVDVDLVSAFVARSLVLAEDVPSGTRRYRLLETIRQYAEETVDDAERTELRNRHADFYIDFVKSAEGMQGPEQLRWLLEADAELENVRAALAWSVTNHNTSRCRAVPVLTQNGAEPAGPCCCSTTPKRSSSCPASRRSRATRSCLPPPAPLAGFHGAFERAAQLAEQALDVAGASDDKLAGLALLVRGNALYSLGDMSGVVQCLERSVAGVAASAIRSSSPSRSRPSPRGDRDTKLPWPPTRHGKVSLSRARAVVLGARSAEHSRFWPSSSSAPNLSRARAGHRRHRAVHEARYRRPRREPRSS